MTEPAAVRLIGGEMIEWSDTGHDLPGGEALEALILNSVPAGGDVLLAGPHRAELVGLLLAHCARVTCLLRSLPDATELHGRYGGSGDLTVLCGGLESLSADTVPGPFDAVVAAGGFRRLGTPDGAPLGWADGLRRLTAPLASGGTLVMAVENELGVHRLVDPAPVETADDQWFPPHGIDATVPAGPDALLSALEETAPRSEAAVTGSGTCYAAYPCLEVPTVLLPVRRLADRLPPDGVPAALVSAALDAGFAGRPVLSDPGRLARTSLGQGLGARLAPGWIAVARPAGALPGALVTDGPGPLAVTCELVESRPAGQRWERRLVTAADTVLAGRIARDATRLGGLVPPGRMLDQMLLTACALCDLPTLRGLLRSYANWMSEQPPAAQPFATPDNVVVDEGGPPAAEPHWALLDPSWELAEPVASGVALVRALRGFAGGLLAGGHRHPWPTTLDVDGITSVLLAMAGRRPDRMLLGQAVRLEAEIVAAKNRLPITDRERLVGELERGLLPSPMGVREGSLERERLITELGEARDRAVWLDATLREKEARLLQATEAHAKARAELRVSRAELQALRASTPYRIGRLIVAPKRRAVRLLRGVRTSAGAATRTP